MKKSNFPLYSRLVIASFFGWAALRVAYRYWQFHPTPFNLSFSGWGIAAFLLGLAAGSSLFLGVFFAFFQWLPLRRYIKSVWGWVLLQLFAWILAGVMRTILIIPLYRLFMNQDVLSTWVRAVIEALIVSLSIATIQNAMLQKSTAVATWWVVFPLIGVFTGIVLERLNQNFVFMDPLYATLLASALIAIIASLPALFVTRSAAVSGGDLQPAPNPVP